LIDQKQPRKALRKKEKKKEKEKEKERKGREDESDICFQLLFNQQKLSQLFYQATKFFLLLFNLN